MVTEINYADSTGRVDFDSKEFLEIKYSVQVNKFLLNAKPISIFDKQAIVRKCIFPFLPLVFEEFRFLKYDCS